MGTDTDELVTEEPPSYATIAREMYRELDAWASTATPWLAIAPIFTALSVVGYVNQGIGTAWPVVLYTPITYYCLWKYWGEYNVE